MKKINNQEEYNNIPDGAILRIFLIGEEWDEDECSIKKVIKIGDRLYEIKDGWFDFCDRCEDGLSFEVYRLKRDMYEV